MSTTTTKLGRMLRLRRICHHAHSPSDAAAACGVTRVAFLGWERGTLPSDRHLRTVAEYLGIPAEEALQVRDGVEVSDGA